MKKIAVLHEAESLHPSLGGPSRTVTKLADALAAFDNIDITLITQSLKGEITVPTNNKSVIKKVFESRSRFKMRLGLPMKIGLNKLTKNYHPDIIHSHGLWQPANHWTVNLAKKYKIPLLIHTRGMLEPWAVNHRSIKKRLALSFYQQGDLNYSSALIATSPKEYENLRLLGYRQPIAIIPNGVDFDDSNIFNEGKKSSCERKIALFLSRIYPVKGVINLIKAWAIIQPTKWQLHIAGPDEGGHLSEVLSLIRDLKLNESIKYIGEVDDRQKINAYQNADLFILPTFSENFGLVIAEALTYGLPVITTKGAPWSDLETFNCGWWIDIGIDPLAKAMKTAMSLSDQERKIMGENGRNYVKRFNWEQIAKNTLELYMWILGLERIPNCVLIK